MAKTENKLPINELKQKIAELKKLSDKSNIDVSDAIAKLSADLEVALREASGLPVELWDERSTTVTAHQYLNDTNTRGRKRKAVVDAVAATIILEAYLAHRAGSARLH